MSRKYIFLGLLMSFFIYQTVDAAAFLRIIEPNGGEVISPDGEITIEWEQSGVEQVYLNVFDQQQPSSISINDFFETATGTIQQSVTYSASRLRCSPDKDYIVELRAHNGEDWITDQSDTAFHVYHEGQDDVSDMSLDIVEPLNTDMVIHSGGEDQLMVQVRHQGVDFFHAGIEGETIGPVATTHISEGLSELRIRPIFGADVFNSWSRIIVKGARNTDLCRSAIDAQYEWVTDTSNDEIFFTGNSSVGLQLPEGGRIPSRSLKEYDPARGLHLFPGDTLPIGWSNSWDVASISIFIQPLLYKDDRAVWRRNILQSLQMEMHDGISYANNGVFNFYIDEDFYTDLPYVNFFGVEDRRFFISIYGYNEEGEQIAQRDSGPIWIWRQRGDEDPYTVNPEKEEQLLDKKESKPVSNEKNDSNHNTQENDAIQDVAEDLPVEEEALEDKKEEVEQEDKSLYRRALSRMKAIMARDTVAEPAVEEPAPIDPADDNEYEETVIVEKTNEAVVIVEPYDEPVAVEEEVAAETTSSPEEGVYVADIEMENHTDEEKQAVTPIRSFFKRIVGFFRGLFER